MIEKIFILQILIHVRYIYDVAGIGIYFGSEKMVLKRDRLDIISEILQQCIGGASKTAIVYKVNLNFKTVNPYLDLLLKRDLLRMSQGSTLVYTTTEKGIKLLEDLQRVRGVLKDLSQQE